MNEIDPLKAVSQDIAKLCSVSPHQLSTLNMLVSVLYKLDKPEDLGWNRLTENVRVDLYYSDRAYYLDVLYVFKPKGHGRQILDCRDKERFTDIVEAVEYTITLMEDLPPGTASTVIYKIEQGG